MNEFFNQEIEEMREFEMKEMEYQMQLEMERDLMAKLEEGDLLSTRAATHGDFSDNAKLVQGFKDLLHTSENWEYLQPYQRESLEMIVHKFGRILTGDPIFVDSWRDIVGYTQLVVDQLPNELGATDVRNTKMEILDGRWVDIC